MTRDEFLKFHTVLCSNARATCRNKSKDYAQDADTHANLRLCETMGLCSTEVGILVRLNDKMARLANVIQHGNAVKDETADDTIEDSINYLILLAAELKNKRLVDEKQLELHLDDEVQPFVDVGISCKKDYVNKKYTDLTEGLRALKEQESQQVSDWGNHYQAQLEKQLQWNQDHQAGCATVEHEGEEMCKGWMGCAHNEDQYDADVEEDYEPSVEAQRGFNPNEGPF